ncbi:hypothetical protein WDW86_05590 [Bdellovibrionota bacterium FG-2]
MTNLFNVPPLAQVTLKGLGADVQMSDLSITQTYGGFLEGDVEEYNAHIIPEALRSIHDRYGKRPVKVISPVPVADLRGKRFPHFRYHVWLNSELTLGDDLANGSHLFVVKFSDELVTHPIKLLEIIASEIDRKKDAEDFLF